MEGGVESVEDCQLNCQLGLLPNCEYWTYYGNTSAESEILRRNGYKSGTGPLFKCELKSGYSIRK